MSVIRKILAVDDEATNLHILEEHLTEAGYAVITAASGQEAITALEGAPDCALVLLDMMMPGMNGLDTLKMIKQNPATSFIPVIMQTASGERTHVTTAKNSGIYYYLLKPYDQKRLLNAVQKALHDSYGDPINAEGKPS